MTLLAMRAKVLHFLGAVVALSLCSCGGRRPRDVDNSNPRSEFVDGPSGSSARRDGGASPAHVLATPTLAGRKPAALVSVDARAIALGSERIYFGDGAEDALVSLPKTGAASEPTRTARRAPMPGALAVDERTNAIAWIPNPGDTVLRLAIGSTSPSTIRDKGIFANVAASDGDVFVTEVQGDGGIVTRTTGSTTTRLGGFTGTPRGLTLDASSVFVATSSRLVAVTRTRSDVLELARGTGFGSPQVDTAFLYSTAAEATSPARVVVRVRKTGGELTTVARDVRDAPIAVDHGFLYWFDASRPALLRAALGDAVEQGRVVTEDAALDHVEALAVDADAAYVAAGTGETARIVVVRLR